MSDSKDDVTSQSSSHSFQNVNSDITYPESWDSASVSEATEKQLRNCSNPSDGTLYHCQKCRSAMEEDRFLFRKNMRKKESDSTL